MTRRDFISTGSIGLAAAVAPAAAKAASPRRLAIVGTGSRGTFTWGAPVVKNYGDVVQLVGLCDINGKRAKVSQGMIGTSAPTYTDFDQMVKETKPDAVMVTTVDATHARYVVRALELGCDAITEKPMCTDEEQIQAMVDAKKKAGKNVTVTFNARHSPSAKKIRELIQEKAIGDVISVEFREYLDTDHGASYFRRWHRLKKNSGTLLVHKASHHFDQANWWLDSEPVEVSAWGELKFYGRNHSFRASNCRNCPHQRKCKFHWDITTNERCVKLYVNCESEDGYLRDRCLWAEDTDIYDSMSVRVRYENGVVLTYTANTYQPFEGNAVSFMGTKGRLDTRSYRGGGVQNRELRLTRSFGQSEIVRDLATRREGGHGGSDTSIQDLVFRNQPDPDPLKLRADMRAGAMSSLIGIAAYRSIERGGANVKIKDLVNL